jgi:hypothetical protein
MERNEKIVEFQLDGLQVRLTLAGERWVARVGHSVAVGRSARQALTVALEPLGTASIRALLADLGLLEPSIAVVEIERSSGLASG